ncbi:thioredoxin family protein [Flavobacterium sp. F-65]|uniref:Thioredoxin family protein n=1 Tax=Flavobacterium pisciphilum TaxID=2893755 RepID=A0ABS8N1R0_9FLAO|nr:thioredoxin family protein [Flavobacterium sp. F-65]MCC9074336.1 thioredoxin family protein [Flavobacterium sp. F-65]
MRFIYLSLLILFIHAGNAQNQFVHDDISYKDALVKAKQENKPVFVMLFATWCPHCNVMKNSTFQDATVMTFLESNYVCVWKDIDKPEGLALKTKFDTKSLPSFIIVDSNETILYNLKGEIKAAEFLNEIKNALNPKMQLPYLEKQFLADPSNANKCLAYLNTLRKGRERVDLSKATHTYLATQSDSQLLTEMNWRIIANGVSDIKSHEFQYVLQHQKEFGNVASPDRVEKKIINIVTELLRPYTESLDTVNYYKQREIAKSIRLQKTDSLIFSYDLTIAERSTNWKYYNKTALDGTQKYVWNTPSALKEIGQVYLKNITDVESLKKSIEWVKRSLEINDAYDGNLLLSRLYIKIKDKKSALVYAKKAKTICEEMGWDSKDADALLAELK